MALVSYDMAIRHLRQQGVLDGSPDDAEVTSKIEMASAIVLLHIKRPAEWDVDTNAEDDPEFPIVQAGVLRVLANLYRFHGDDENSPSPISPDVVLLLEPIRFGPAHA